ncbi:MAG: hypothetical protein KatS3mg023_3743 [Armatimonadota bacterium]|nr:MAG: hypothetical protein KatS3mg023_3743 [Armatimonadota bacterium]
MTDKEFMLLQIPGREDATINIILDKSVNNDYPYQAKHVRRLAWLLSQALPLHVIESLIHELMLYAQETIIRGARMEASQKGKRLVFSVKDEAESPFPGQLMLWYDDRPVEDGAPSDELEIIDEPFDDLEDESDE